MSYRFRVRDLALLVAVVAIILQGGLTASAATVTWTGSGTNTGYYSDGLNWDTSAVPTSADDAVIGLAGTVYINSGDAYTATSLTINGGATATFQVKSGGKFTTTGDITLAGGSNTVGALKVTGGTLSTQSLNVTNTNQSTSGSVTISSGKIIIGDNKNFAVSNGGTGEVTQTGGTVVVGDGKTINHDDAWFNAVWLTHDTIGNGTYTLNGGLLSTPVLGMSWTVGTATFNLNGGTLSTASVTGHSQWGTIAAAGTFNFNGGTLKMVASNADLFGKTYTGYNGAGVANIYVKTGGAKIDTQGYNVTINQALVCTEGASSDGGLVKTGTGTLTLKGANSYLGNTVVQEGTLNYYGTNVNLAGFVVSGGTLSGTTLGSNISMSSGMLSPSSATSKVGTLSGVNLVTTGGKIKFDLYGTTTVASDSIALTGSADLGSATTVEVTLLNQILGAGTYTLVNAASGFNSAIASLPTFDITNTRITSYTWESTATALTLTAVGQDAKSLTWDGSADNVWKLAGASTWKDSAGADEKFYRGDNVVFDDSGIDTAITVTGTVSPIDMKVAGSQDYTFSGTGKIYVTRDFTVDSSGTLEIKNTGGNEFVNDVVVASTSTGAFNLSGAGINTFDGNLTINGGNASLVTTSTAGYNVVAGNLNIGTTAGTYTLTKLQVNGDVNLTPADTTITSTSYNLAVSNSVIAGTLLANSGTSSITGGTVGGYDLQNGGVGSITGTTVTGWGVACAGTMTYSNVVNAGTVYVSSGSLTMSDSGGTISVGAIDLSGGTLNVNSNLKAVNGSGINNGAQFVLADGKSFTNSQYTWVGGGGVTYLSIGGSRSFTSLDIWQGGSASHYSAIDVSGNAKFTVNGMFNVYNWGDSGTDSLTIGGSATVSSCGYLFGGWGNGTANVTQTSGSVSTVNDFGDGWIMGLYVGGYTSGAKTVYNMAGGNLNVSYGEGILVGGAGGNGILALKGGTVTALSITSGSAGYVALNGAQIVATEANASFISGAGKVVVDAGGAKIKSDYDVTISAALTAPAGVGVTSVAVADGGTGYTSAPVVVFSGGTGTGMSGYAKLVGGAVSEIVITSAGSGYASTDIVAASLVGGNGSGASLGTVTLAEITGGGLTKTGTGMLTLSGETSYAGETNVQAGVVAFTASAVTLKSAVNVADGAGVTFGTAYVAPAPAEVPEPSTLVLLALAGLGAFAAWRKR